MPHYYALSQDGVLESAPNALGGIDYYCSHCNAVMRVRKCVTRISHFFLYNDSHKSRDCGEFEKERNIIRSPSLMSPKKFAHTVMYPYTRTKGTGKSGSKKNPPSSSKEMLPPNSIRQLIVCGVRAMDPSVPIEVGILSDIYVGPKAYAKFFKEGTELSFRVADLWLHSALDRRIRYVANWSYQGQLFRAFFEHHVVASLDFEALADTLFHERRYYYGRTLWLKPKYKTIAIGGEWTTFKRIDCQNICGLCKGSKRICQGMWTSPLNHLGQIYYSDLPNNKFDY